MRIAVFSDSHGNEDNMVRAVERERPSTLDAIVHLGDGWRDAEALLRLYPRIPLEQVPGNCDLGRFEERERVVFFGDCRVLLCHGHTLGVKSSLLRASYEARERGAQALLYGHTHIPHIDYHDGLWLVNPGSIGDPKRLGIMGREPLQERFQPLGVGCLGGKPLPALCKEQGKKPQQCPLDLQLVAGELGAVGIPPSRRQAAACR